MQLKSLESPQWIERVAGWLSEECNHRWLDLGTNGSTLSPALVKILAQKQTYVMRVFTADEEDTPIGVVGLQNVNHMTRTATYWVVLGNKQYARQGYATRASSKLLTLGFRDLGLHSIQTFCVEGNVSVRMVERLNFKYIGRQRECHCIEGKFVDRLLFDLLSDEHVEINECETNQW